MSWEDLVGEYAGQLRRARRLQRDGRSGEACTLLDDIARRAPAAPLADALVQRLSALLNLGRAAELPAAVAAAHAAVQDLPDPYLRGHLHALAAVAAGPSPDRAAVHLVEAARALTAVREPGDETAWAWHDLAVASSYRAFHGPALTALDQARAIGTACGIAPEALAGPGIRLRAALAVDHHGDTDGCLRALRDLGTEADRYTAAGTLGRTRPGARAAYAYAAARRAALGDDAPPFPPADTGDSARALELSRLTSVCHDIAAGRTAVAVAALETMTAPETVGAAEPPRLRSIAYARAGDHAAAHAADRQAFRLSTARIDAIRDGYLAGLAARLDAGDGRRGAGRQRGDALADPLTGLPNRRYLERYVATLLARGERAAIGVCDLTGSGTVQVRHGRHAADLVRQRCATVLDRVMRRGDVVARYREDEFVVVLPGAGPEQAADVTRRISAAVAAEDWSQLAGDVPVGVAVGWADVSATGRGLTAALAAAAVTRSEAAVPDAGEVAGTPGESAVTGSEVAVDDVTPAAPPG